MTDFLNNIVSAWNDEEAEKESELYPDETNSPNINILIRNARKFLDGKLTEDEFLAEVDSTAERLDSALEEIQRYGEAREEGDPAKTLAEQSELAYEEFGQGLEEMAEGNPDGIQRGIEICIDAAHKLEYLNHRHFELEYQANLVECLMCSHQNSPDRTTCEKCSAQLPTSLKAVSAEAQAQSSDLVMVPKEYVELYDACDKVATGAMSVEDWQQQIDLFNERFNMASQQIHDITSSNRALLAKVPQILEEAESVVDALDEALEAMYKMQMFAEDGNVEHLNQGWMDLMSGTQKVQQRGLAFYKNLESAQGS